MNGPDVYPTDGLSLDHDGCWAPDGLTLDMIDRIEAEAFAEAARERRAELTSWLAMTEDERASIRPRATLHAVPTRPARPHRGPLRGGEAA